MSRPGRRRSLSILIAALFALALPAAAQAANYTIVPGGGTCGGPDTVCGSFDAASTAAANGDNFTVTPGTYDENVPFGVGVNITGQPGARLEGTLTFTGTGLSKVTSFSVIQSNNGPAIISSGAGGIEMTDSLAVSAQDDGVRITNSTVNKIVRSTILTAGFTGDTALKLDATANGPNPIGLDMSSSIVTGGNVGLGAYTTLLGGNINVTARHVTITGDAGVQAQSVLLGGTITAVVRGSISLTNDLSKLASGSSVTFPSTLTTGDQSVIFADPGKLNFHLRPDSPAIGAAGALDPSESQTDIDGQMRPLPTDQGADEYTNTAPTAAIAITSPGRRSGQPVSFSGAASRDQPGGGIASYHWQFGDGATATTTTPSISHAYSGTGPVTASLTVVDGEGAMSAPASVNLTIVESTAPAAIFTKPKNNEKIFQFVRKTKTVTRNGKRVKIKVKTKRRTRIRFAGVAADASGILRVYMTLQKLDDSSTSKCRWLDSKTGLRRLDCDEPLLIRGHLRDDGTWFYNVRKSIKLPKGTYRARVYAIDKTGNVGNLAPTAKNIKFKIR